eukprot:tig00021326_g20276.t1
MEQQATHEFEVALLRGDAPRPEAAPAPVPLAISTPGPETFKFYSVPGPAHLLTPPCPAPSASSPRAPVPLRHSAAARTGASSAHGSPFLRPLPPGPGPPDAAAAPARGSCRRRQAA